jgi:hypothetical protein
MPKKEDKKCPDNKCPSHKKVCPFFENLVFYIYLRCYNGLLLFITAAKDLKTHEDKKCPLA